MFADVELTAASRQALVIPEDSVIETGRRRLVFVKDSSGKLSQREITTGERSGHLFEVRSGLVEGEQVAAGASFLLDSEARLQGISSDEGKVGMPETPAIPDLGARTDHNGHSGHEHHQGHAP